MSAKTGTTFQSIFLAAVIVAIGALLLGGEPFSKAELRVDPPSPSPARVDGLMQRQNGARDDENKARTHDEMRKVHFVYFMHFAHFFLSLRLA